jgi:glycine hydroxymethyltransferase/Rap guanine nucleotide exchange factor 1
LQIGELSEAPFPKDILDRPLPNRVSWIENRSTQILRNDFSIMTLPVADVARAFLLHDLNMFAKLRRMEMIARAYPRLVVDLAHSGVLQTITAKWNATQTWVSNELVSTPKLKERAHLLERFILLAEECLAESRNFHTFYAIMFGLKDPTVTRLKTTWQRLSADAFALFKELDKETDFGRGYRTYRASVLKQKEEHPEYPVVPFVGPEHPLACIRASSPCALQLCL